jgi:hypothetical protein
MTENDKKNKELAEKRTCSACKEEKQLSEFWKDKRNKDGFMNACKECRRTYLSLWRQSNPEAARKHSHENYTNHKEEHGAHRFLCDNIKAGKISKPENCSKCGKRTADLHGHHEDYAKRLEVRWLCRVCHKQVHKSLIDRIEEGEFDSDAGKVQLLRLMGERDDWCYIDHHRIDDFISQVGLKTGPTPYVHIHYIIDKTGKLRDACLEWLRRGK